jgi:6-phosphogluconate dehydrogenase
MAKIWRAAASSGPSSSDFIKQAYDKSPELATLLGRRLLPGRVSGAQARGGGSWPRAQQGIPAPGFASAPGVLRRPARQRLPAALIQGQRDFFGAHTYHRVDKEGSFHTCGPADRSLEVRG